jgi:DNA-binding Lrp family transcriptional regulator
MIYTGDGSFGGLIGSLEKNRAQSISTLPSMEKFQPNLREEIPQEPEHRRITERFEQPRPVVATSENIVIFVGVTLDKTVAAVEDKFIAAMRSFSEVAECYMITGQFDFLLKLSVPNMAVYGAFIREKLHDKRMGVSGNQTFSVIEAVKSPAASDLSLLRA